MHCRHDLIIEIIRQAIKIDKIDEDVRQAYVAIKLLTQTTRVHNTEHY